MPNVGEKYLVVHLAPPDVVAAHIADPDPELSRSSALATAGEYHKLQGGLNVGYKEWPGAEDRDEQREYFTSCGLTLRERPDRMEEVENQPTGALCPKCFGKKGK